MFETIRGYRSERNVGAARPTDPLLKDVVMDVLITTTGFVLLVVAVLLALQGLSVN
jgi:hypothetical protein